MSSVAKRPVSWRSRFKTVILSQLRQGVSPHKLALTVALGSTIGLFPVVGITTLLCIAVGAMFKLNQPLLQLVNYAFFPVQLLMIYGFLRLGEWITLSEPLPLTPNELIHLFKTSPKTFFADFGMSGLKTILGWAIIAPFFLAAIYYALIPLLKNLMRNYRIKSSGVSGSEVT